MFTVTAAQLNAWLIIFIWPFVRILALLSTDPIFGNRAVPGRIKIGAAILLTLVLIPTLGPPPPVELGSASGMLILMQQIIIGVAMGLVMRIVFSAVEMAGNLAALQMGLGFATFFDHFSAAQVPVIGQFTGLLAILMFLSTNGHFVVLTALSESFYTLPITAQPLSAQGWRTVAEWGGEIFRAGVWISLPIVAALLITNLALGIMTRAAPQLNIFAVGFPLTIFAGFFLLYLTLPFIPPLFERLWTDGIGTALEVFRQARPSAP